MAAWEAWQLAALEDLGLMDTSTGLVNRVARELAKSPNDTIETEEFRRAFEDRKGKSWLDCAAASTPIPLRRAISRSCGGS